MNDSDISQFINSFEDFMKHAEEEIDSYQKREEIKHYEKFWEEVNYFARKYEVTCDYILQEFYIDNK